MEQYGAFPSETQITLTFFDDKFAKVAYRDTLTLAELADEIQRMSDTHKRRLPWLKLAVFGDTPSAKGCLRTNANLREITGIEIDYDDGEMPFDAAVELLAAAHVRAIVYTSASYIKGEKEKWRVLAPLSTPFAPRAREGFVSVVNGLLGGVAAPESFVLSTAFYYGSVKNNPAHRVELVEGDCVDLRPELWAGRIGKPDRIKGDPIASKPGAAPGYDDAEIQALLERSQMRNRDGGMWHNSMVSVTASLVMKGRSDDEIFEITAPYCNAGYGDPDLAVLVLGARAKWKRQDPDVAAIRTNELGTILAGAGVRPPPKWREYLKSGLPRATLHNAMAAIEHAGVRCSEDSFHRRLYLGRSEAGGDLLRFMGEMTDVSILQLRMFLSDRYGLDFGERNVRDAALGMAHANAFDPVLDMLAEAQASWDGRPRLDRMAVDHFNCADTELNRQCVRKTMIAAVARARQPGCKFDTILVMESREGWNKSSAWALLAGENNFSDAAVIGHAGREVQEELATIWIHENAELAGMRKADVEVVKAFASRQIDRARPAYGRLLVAQPRRSIEVGTTNSDRYLLSMDGNRRFWPIRILAPIDLARLKAARLQLWGEAAAAEAGGEGLALPETLWSAAGAEQEARRVQHPWETLLAGMLSVYAPGVYGGNAVIDVVSDEQRVATAHIFEHVLKVPTGQLNNGHSKTLADIMRIQGWKNTVFRSGEKIVRGYKKGVK